MGSAINNLLLYRGLGEEKKLSHEEIEQQVDDLMKRIWFMGRGSLER